MTNRVVVAAAASLCSLAANAHHSDAALDMNVLVSFQGTVSEYSMRTPHSYFTVDVTGDEGTTVIWTERSKTKF